MSLTRGAVGLAVTFHAELTRVAACADDARVFLIAEDDAAFVADFGARFDAALAALDAHDPAWDFLQVGYFGDDRTFAKPDIKDKAVRKLIAVPENVAGTGGIAFRPPGARNVLRSLFPVDWQLDTALKQAYRSTRAYITRVPLMTSAHSTQDNSDIQILPEGFAFDAAANRPPAQKFKVKIQK